MDSYNLKHMPSLLKTQTRLENKKTIIFALSALNCHFLKTQFTSLHVLPSFETNMKMCGGKSLETCNQAVCEKEQAFSNLFLPPCIADDVCQKKPELVPLHPQVMDLTWILWPCLIDSVLTQRQSMKQKLFLMREND